MDKMLLPRKRRKEKRSEICCGIEELTCIMLARLSASKGFKADDMFRLTRPGM